MQKSKKIARSLLNTSNVCTLGAVFFSISMGNVAGLLLFVAATAIGTRNKYRELNIADGTISPRQKEDNVLLRFLNKPSITARTITIGAAINCLGSAARCIYSEEERLKHFAETIMWGLGVIGDFAVLNLDKVNFNEEAPSSPEEHSKLRQAFNAATANPSVYYNLESIVLTLYMLSQGMSTLATVATIATASIFSYGIYTAVKNTLDAAQGKIDIKDINDGQLNYLSATGCLAISLINFANGEYATGAAFIAFGLGEITALYETRDALKSEQKKSPSISPISLEKPELSPA